MVQSLGKHKHTHHRWRRSETITGKLPFPLSLPILIICRQHRRQPNYRPIPTRVAPLNYPFRNIRLMVHTWWSGRILHKEKANHIQMEGRLYLFFLISPNWINHFSVPRLTEASCGDMLKMQMVREGESGGHFLSLRPLRADPFHHCQVCLGEKALKGSTEVQSG